LAGTDGVDLPVLAMKHALEKMRWLPLFAPTYLADSRWIATPIAAPKHHYVDDMPIIYVELKPTLYVTI
jgi:hypothetical protein